MERQYEGNGYSEASTKDKGYEAGSRAGSRRCTTWRRTSVLRIGSTPRITGRRTSTGSCKSYAGVCAGSAMPPPIEVRWQVAAWRLQGGLVPLLKQVAKTNVQTKPVNLMANDVKFCNMLPSLP